MVRILDYVVPLTTSGRSWLGRSDRRLASSTRIGLAPGSRYAAPCWLMMETRVRAQLWRCKDGEMRVFLIGAGGREHALAWALSASPLLTKLYAAPGNAGICGIAECVPIDLRITLQSSPFAARRKSIWWWSGPKRRWSRGWSMISRRRASAPSGRRKAAAQLEGSKGFTKDLCREAGIPTAAYRAFYRSRMRRATTSGGNALPIVVKADGLAAGKGVTVADDARRSARRRSTRSSPRRTRRW